MALNGKVYAIGGEGEAGESLDAVEEYDCATNTSLSVVPYCANICQC